MFSKFMILIGLKQPETDFPEEELIQSTGSKVLPSSEKRFIPETEAAEITVHSAEDEVEIRAIRSWSEIESLGNAIKEFNIKNTHRAVGTRLSHYIYKEFDKKKN